MADDFLLGIFKNYPALQRSDWNIIDSRAGGISKGRRLEFYPPDERDNPTPGRPTIEVFDPSLTDDGLQRAIFGDMLHYQPRVDPQFAKLRQDFIGTITPEQLETDIAAYRRAQQQEGETRSFSDWFNVSRLDAYIRGYIAPDDRDEWRDTYTDEQTSLLDAMTDRLKQDDRERLTKLRRLKELRVKAQAPEFAARAAEMDPMDLAIARSKNDAFGAYLRADAEKPIEGETEEARAKRLYGSLESEDPVGMAEGMARAYTQGGMFAGGDEAVAAAAAALNKVTGRDPGRGYSEIYNMYLEKERRKLEQFREEHPVIATGTEIAGAIPTAVALPGARAGQGATMIPRMAAGGTTAAIEGGIYGYAAGEGGAKQRLKEAGKTAAIAAPIGVAAPVAGDMAKKVATRAMTNRAAARNTDMSRAAFDTLSRAAEADRALYGPGAARIAAAGDDAMVADAGPSMTALLDTAVQRSGPAGSTARAAVEQRAQGAAKSITQALDDAFGKPVGIRSVERGIRQGTQAARQSAYDTAYSKAIDYASPTGRQIEKLVNTRVPKSAVTKANALMRAEGERSRQILVDVADDGTVSFRQMPDVRQIDYLTRGLNEVADAQNAKGKLGGTTQLGRAYGNLSRELRNLTRDAVPEYGQALDTAATAIEARNAARFGRKVLTRKVTMEDVADELAGMSQAERSYAMNGVRGFINDTLANVKSALTDGNIDVREAIGAGKALSTRANREKITSIIGEDAAADLFASLDKSMKAFELRASVAQNSRTFARLAIDDQIKRQTEEGVVNAVRSGEPVNATKRMAQILMGRTEGAKQRIADETYGDLVDVLVRRRGQDAARVLREMDTAAANVGPESERIRMLAELLSRSGAAPIAGQVGR